jgi:nuclease S1
MCRFLCQGLLLFVLLACWAAPSQAWGPDGHWIVGKIAEEHMSPNAARRLRILFGQDVSLAEIANWADEVREERPETAAWHYTNIPPEATELDMDRDCPNDDCITAQIRRLVGIVRLGIRTSEERQEALKLLVYLAGDLHQPLHAGYGSDRGGNDIPVVFDGRQSDLHAFWDSTSIRLLGDDRAAVASRLARSVTPEQKKEWRQGGPRDWTWESHLLAVRVAYATLPPGNPKQLDADYARRARIVTEEQLAKAGIRLAKLLDDVWAN